MPEVGKLGAAFDPRTRLYRDPFNELVVFVISAAGAGVLIPTLLTLISAFAGKLDFLPFVGISVLLELVLIFGLLRPAMRPAEKLGWGLLWAFGAAVLGAAFWELTYIQLLCAHRGLAPPEPPAALALRPPATVSTAVGASPSPAAAPYAWRRSRSSFAVARRSARAPSV